MTDEVCPECKGNRWRTVGDKAQPCICLVREMLANYLGPDLAGATRIQEGPLYAVDRDFNITLDRTSENLFIKASWPALLPHLRLAIGHRWRYVEPTFRFAILTDERVINVYVGNERYAARPKGNRDDMTSFNGLKDLVEGPRLVIVRLGFLGHKNIAAPGALKQALMIREAARKPTWVVQNPQGDYPISWNEEVAAYIAEYFDVVDLRKLSAATVSPQVAPTMEVEEHETKTTRSAKPTPSPELLPTVDEDPMGVTRAGKAKAGYKRPWKKRRDNDDNDGGGGGDMPPV
jgi:hypothetical protein